MKEWLEPGLNVFIRLVIFDDGEVVETNGTIVQDCTLSTERLQKSFCLAGCQIPYRIPRRVIRVFWINPYMQVHHREYNVTDTQAKKKSVECRGKAVSGSEDDPPRNECRCNE